MVLQEKIFSLANLNKNFEGGIIRRLFVLLVKNIK